MSRRRVNSAGETKPYPALPVFRKAPIFEHQNNLTARTLGSTEEGTRRSERQIASPKRDSLYEYIPAHMIGENAAVFFVVKPGEEERILRRE